MALFLQQEKNRQRLVAIFDIGSGSIGGALVGIDEKNIPEIIFTVRRGIPFQEEFNFRRFLSLMGKTLEAISLLMQKASGAGVVAQAYCTLASPWYASQTRLVRYAQETPFTVTVGWLDKLMQKEILLFRDSKLFLHAKAGDPPPEIMESKNMQTKLNGYALQNLYGKKAIELESALYISMIPVNIRTSILASITKFLNLPTVHFSSFSFSAFDTIRGIFPDEHSFLFMDIAGEVTDLSLVNDGVLFESVSFPAGKNLLIRGIVRKMKITPALAISELELYAAHRSTPEHTKYIEEVLTETTQKWRGFFEDALSRFAAEFPIPRAIFYTTDDNITEWFERAIRETDLSKFSQEHSVFTVRSLGSVCLNKFVHPLEPDFQDPFLAIETIFAHKCLTLTRSN